VEPDPLSNPVLNRPYDAPTRWFEIGRNGPTGVVQPGRRPSESLVPIAASRKGALGSDGSVQQILDVDVTAERRAGSASPSPSARSTARVSPSYIKSAAREAVKAGDIDLVAVLGFAFDAQATEVTETEGSPSPPPTRGSPRWRVSAGSAASRSCWSG